MTLYILGGRAFVRSGSVVRAFATIRAAFDFLQGVQ